jgi:hypothetical protein
MAWSDKHTGHCLRIVETFPDGSSCQTEQKDAPGEAQVLMGSGYGISSLTLFVSDLDSAQIHFTDVLGFSAPGPKMTEDGLIGGTVMTAFPFADTSSIELSERRGRCCGHNVVVEDLEYARDGLYVSAAQLSAAIGQVISTLRKYGFKNTAILDEGVLVWTQMGLPVQSGE